MSGPRVTSAASVAVQRLAAARIAHGGGGAGGGGAMPLRGSGDRRRGGISLGRATIQEITDEIDPFEALDDGVTAVVEDPLAYADDSAGMGRATARYTFAFGDGDGDGDGDDVAAAPLGGGDDEARRDAADDGCVPASPTMRRAVAAAFAEHERTRALGIVRHVPQPQPQPAPSEDEQPAPSDDSHDEGGGGGGGGSDAGRVRGGRHEPEHVFRRRAAAAAAAGDTADKVRAGARKRDYARLVPEPATAAEEEHQVENDEDALRWRAVKNPRIAERDDVLGAPQPRTECWGCMHGDKNSSAVSSTALAQLTRLYSDNRFMMTPDALGVMLQRHYDKYIRGPTLDARMRLNGSVPLPEWRAATIIDHFTNHRAEPQAMIEKRLDQLGNLADHLIDNGVYRAPVLAEKPAPHEVRVNEKSVRMFLAVVNAEKQVYSLRAKEMHGYNPEIQLGAAAREFVRNKHTTVAAIRKRTVFDASAPPAP